MAPYQAVGQAKPLVIAAALGQALDGLEELHAKIERLEVEVERRGRLIQAAIEDVGHCPWCCATASPHEPGCPAVNGFRLRWGDPGWDWKDPTT